MSNNRLIVLPREIISLGLELRFEEPKKSDLKGIFLGGNPLRIPPPKVIRQGRKAVVKYFQKMDEKILDQLF